MDSGGPGDPVTLLIKAPNQKYEDQTIHCSLHWTVGQLKSHIAQVYPSRPPREEQRLVYSGRLLQDHLQLRDVLRKQDDYHTMHLVCAHHSPPASPEHRHHAAVLPESTSSDATPTQDIQPASSSSPLVPGGSDGLRSRSSFPSTAGSPQWPDGGQVALQGSAPPPAYLPLQVLWWQQMYARHYYMQYQAAVAASQPPGPSSSPSYPSLSRPPAPPNEAVPPPPPLGARREPEPLPENQAADANLQMNAQGGAVLNDDELNRDWLDWLYTVARGGVLLGIIYFYSSFSRLVMVVGTVLLLYLHQARWFPFRAEQQQRGAERGAAPLEEQQEMERLMDDGMEEDESGEEGGGEGAEEQAATPPPEVGYLTAAWSFVSTFFTSLIPEGRPHPAN